MFINDTISAIVTGLTDSGVGIIRISGKNAIEIGDNLFRAPSGNKVLKNTDSHILKYGFVVNNRDEIFWKERIVDEVMAVVMKAPRSYTGEDTVEIQCHGGVFVMQKILSLTLEAGARLAEPGEFTKRAFLNGRIDLTKAEAVMDVIHSQNEYALASSVSQLKGSLAEIIKELRKKIIYEIAYIESALDDPEHISLENYSEGLYRKIHEISVKINELIQTSEDGKIVKEGIDTVIIGKPNAGKSSFLNLLLGEERAIVTDIAGTTRDVLKESVRLCGICLNIVDTAGIRETDDVIEKIGVERAKKFAENADLVVYIADTSVPPDESDKDIIPILKDKKVIILMNKADLECKFSEQEMKEFVHSVLPEKNDLHVLSISAKEGKGIGQFEQTVKDMFFGGEIKVNNQVLITNIRHKTALCEAYDSLQLVEKSILDEMPEDFFSIDLMNAYAALGRIIGEEVDDDLVNEIFTKFCMGK